MQLFCKIFLIFHAFQHNKNFRNPREAFIIVRNKLQNKRFFSIILFFYVFPLKNFLNEVLTPSIIYMPLQHNKYAALALFFPFKPNEFRKKIFLYDQQLFSMWKTYQSYISCKREHYAVNISSTHNMRE